MWSIALLVNSNDWKDLQTAWTLICRTFFSWYKDTLSHPNRHYDALLERITKIKGDPNLHVSIDSTRDDHPTASDVYTFDNEDDMSYNEKQQLSYTRIEGRRRQAIPRVTTAIFFHLF